MARVPRPFGRVVVLKKFLASKSGNVAMMFGLFLIPMLLGAGVAIDMLRANQVRSMLTEAADSGLLAAVRAKTLDGTLNDVQAEKLARDYFDANYAQSAGITIDTFDFSTDPATETFRLLVTGRLKTSIMGVVGNKSMPIDIVSEAKYAPGRPLGSCHGARHYRIDARSKDCRPETGGQRPC